jgi:hypothetical protein
VAEIKLTWNEVCPEPCSVVLSLLAAVVAKCQGQEVALRRIDCLIDALDL